MRPLFLFLLLCLSSYLHAQYTLSATVVLPDKGRPAGNAVILETADSSYVVGSFFVEGELVLESVPYGSYLLKLTSLEYADTIIEVSHFEESELDLGSIVVLPTDAMLDLVTVKARRPTFVQRAGGAVEVTVEGTTLAASSSAVEILSKTPEVVVDEDGEITVFGRGAATIFLDNQKISPSQLSIILPSQIRSIEIIRNPPPRYDAEGGAVVVIRSVRFMTAGSRLSLQQNTEYSDFAGGSAFVSADYQYSREKWLWQSMVSIQRGKSRHIKGTTRTRPAEYVFIDSDLYTEWLPLSEYDMQYGLGVQRQLEGEGYFSMKYVGSSALTTGSISSTNTILTADSRGDFDVNINRDERDHDHSLSINYEQPINPSGSTVFAGGQLFKRSSDHLNPISEQSLFDGQSSTRSLVNLVDRDITIASGQLDYQHRPGAAWGLDMGLKYGYVGNTADASFLVGTETGGYEEDSQLSNFFGYDEHIAAGYVDVSKRLSDKVSIRAGLRSEYTSYSIEVDGSNEDISDEYMKLFPALSIESQFSDSYRLGLSYTESIIRQNYDRLNPALIYQDPYTSIQGNPFLLPEKVRTIELSILLAGTTVKLGYSLTTDPFSGAAIPGADSLSYILIRLNLDRQHSYYASLSRTFAYRGFSSSISLSQSYSRAQESEVGLQGRAAVPQFYAYTTSRQSLGRGYSIEALAYYYTAYVDGTINRLPAGSLTLSLDKKYLDDALTVRLIANDILHTQRADGDYRAGVTDITFRNKWGSNYFRFAVSYSLSQTSSDFRSKEISRDAVRRAR